MFVARAMRIIICYISPLFETQLQKFDSNYETNSGEKCRNVATFVFRLSLHESTRNLLCYNDLKCLISCISLSHKYRARKAGNISRKLNIFSS